mgnify:CR=1 FL=1
MTLTLITPQVSNVRAILLAAAPVTTPQEAEANATTNTLVIAPMVLVTSLESTVPLDPFSGVNILGEGSGTEGSYVHNLPEIFTPFSE